MAYSELLGRSCFSFLRGASLPEEIVDRSKELGLSAVALCDRNGLYGSVRAYVRAREIEHRVLVGAELSIALPTEIVDRSNPWKGTTSKGTEGPERPVLVLLVESHEGYANLCRLLTLAHEGLPKGESLLDLDWLEQHRRGLVAIAPSGKAPSSSDAPPGALLARLHEVFREKSFLAVHRHLDGFDDARVSSAITWSKRYGLSIVASARPLFHHRSRKPLADVMQCIREGITLDRAGVRLESNAEASLKSEEQMRRLFRDHPEWVDRSSEIASCLDFSLKELRYRFPCRLDPGETADRKLAKLTWEGARRRYPTGVPDKVAQQIEKELALIGRLGVAPYFLSTWEIVEIARARKILCQGRGSAANSAVCYVLGITAVDPARSNLLFERFMSAERSEPPDIDIDFEHERREEVIQEIYERYGRDHSAMVSEVICYRGKSSLREVGKVFGLSLEQIDRLASAITHWDTAAVSDRRLAEYGFDVGDRRLRKVIMLARALQGFPRHLSVHVGGFVLSATPLCEVAPVEPARMEDRTVVPWDKDDLEALGFFKVDILGLGMLTAIRKSLSAIHDSKDAGTEPPFDPLEAVAQIPSEVPAVYEMIARADTVGVFQIESRAQMAMLPRLRPERYYDLVIEVAIVRPGPIQGGMVHPYLRRRSGDETVTCPHPELWPILERTLGVPLFQEQVMQIAITGAGYTGGQADRLRRDMAAWKKTGRLLRHRQRLLDGFAKKGISRRFGEALFEQIKGFGDYGFPESHAASFALLVYASSWLKCHYPAHFVCALLNSQPMGFYSPSSLVRDAQKHGVEVRDVSVSDSEWDCSLEAPTTSSCDEAQASSPGADRAVRLGFRLIKGFGRQTADAIVEARAVRPFAGLEDLVRRVSVEKGEIEALAEAGALEKIAPGRRQALWKARAPRVPGLFEHLDVREPVVQLPPLRRAEQLVLDYCRKGLSLTDHPMCPLRAKMKKQGVLANARLEDVARGERVSVAGLVLTRQRPVTASGVVFMTLEDETGTANLILHREVFDRFRLAARHATLLRAWGRVERHVNESNSSSRLESKPVPVIHLLVDRLERLDVPGRSVTHASRDFH